MVRIDGLGALLSLLVLAGLLYVAYSFGKTGSIMGGFGGLGGRFGSQQ